MGRGRGDQPRIGPILCDYFCLLKNNPNVKIVGVQATIENIRVWLFSRKPFQIAFNEPAKNLLFGMTVTSRCRYNASIRIRNLSQFSFFTTVILSLGLILIPLLQNANIQLAYPPGVLNMLQIFLAVAVLVYSIINSTAKYETRAQRLNDCGDKIKELIRELRVSIASGGVIDLNTFNRRYTDISTDSENHVRADYWLVVVRTPEYYNLSGFPRLWTIFKAHSLKIPPYVIPTLLLLLEVIFILDMLGITCVLTRYLHPLNDAAAG
jgi:hypothetical protein